MAKGVTSNYFALDTEKLELISAAEGQTSQNASMPDENGDIVIEEVYGIRRQPKNTCAILADFDIAANVILGTLHDGSADLFTVLTSFNVNTEAGAAPTIDFAGEEVITGSVQGRTVTMPAQLLLKRHKAQILFSAFSFTAAGVHLTKCSASGKVNLTRSPDAEGVAWDVSGGRIEVQATFKKSAATALVLTSGAGWVITSPLELTESDKDYEEYSVTLALNIDGTEPGV